MKNDQVCEVIGLADLHEVLQDVVTSVDSDGIWDDQLHLFLELNESLTGTS